MKSNHVSRVFKTVHRAINLIVQEQNINFWVLAAFLPVFIGARFIVYNFPDLFLLVGGVHVHHLTYGIIMLAVFGIVTLNFPEEAGKPFWGLFYGAGLALAFDEFGMWLHLEDDYWIRHSYDAIILISSFLIAVVYIVPFIKSSIFHFRSVRAKVKNEIEHIVK
jgi:hypothetical protein